MLSALSLSPSLSFSCLSVSLANVQCKARDANPLSCVEQGKAVTQCAIDVFR